ncbi:MAG: Fmu (Sun) domain-containing protein [Ginsengibacter sp.]
MKSGELSSNNNGTHFHRYLNYAIAILEKYNGTEPFHLYLKKYFSANKKHGSKDRKQITSLCYDYFRIAFAVSSEISIHEKLLLATFLIERKPSALLEKLKPEWNDQIDLDISSKIELVKGFFSEEKLFPFTDELSDEIDRHKFSLSFLIQPKLFIRIRPGYKNVVFEKLKSAKISFEKNNESSLVFSNNEKVSEILNIDKEVVIQDYNSQQTLTLLQEYIKHPTSDISLWDCCAASGGKSILAFDLLKNAELTVSDTRKSILENLKKRFKKAGIKKYYSFVADLSVSSPLEGIKGRPDFDFIIADVPCSGSGTWARIPEQMHFFSKKEIEEYSILQQKIVSNAIEYLNENGCLLYITCSVFKKENEENVAFFQENLNLQLIKYEYLKGYEMQADTLFAALFKKAAG